MSEVLFERMFLDPSGSLRYEESTFVVGESEGATFQVLYTTICGSDLRIIANGDPRIKGPRVLGHEIVAKVIQPGGRKDFAIGDFVAIGADIPCGKCRQCLLNQENLCIEHVALGYQLNGGLSSILNVPSAHLGNAPVVKIAPRLSAAAYALAEPIGCVLHGLEYSNVQNYHRILILGGGPIGIMLASVCKDYLNIPVDNISIIEPFGVRRDFIERLGFHVESGLPISPFSEELKFDRVFTATSNPESHKNVLNFIRRGGKINFFGGVPKNTSRLGIDPNLLHYSEISIEGSHGSCPRHHENAAKLIARDENFWASLITLKTSLKLLPSAIERLRTGLEIKVAVEFSNAQG